MLAILIFQLTLLVYHQVTTWCDLFPFNGVRFTRASERRTEALVNFTLMALPPVGFMVQVEPLMKFGLIYYFVLFAVECATWWLPYFFGASQKWVDIYARVHSGTITVLPRRGHNPAPNLEHLILMVLTLAAGGATVYGFRLLHPEPVPGLWIGWTIGLLVGVGTAYSMMGNATKPSLGEAGR